MNNLGELLSLSSRQKVKIIESLHGCENCYFNSTKGCKKLKYLPKEYTCKSDERLDNKNIIYKRVK